MEHEHMSGTVFDDYTPSRTIMGDSEEDYTTEDDMLLPDPAPSGRSSISSFPASIVHHNITPSQTFPQNILHTPSRSRTGTPTGHQHDYKSASPLTHREYVSGFRNPSSVRALQMRDEFSDEEDLTPGHRRRGSRMSYVSYRSGSAHSTPGKRLSRSLQGSPVKNNSRLRKEFPLVLLHCSIMPSAISPKAKLVNEELLEAIVPEPYKRRWKILQDKTIRNGEVCERGVLIPHPRDDYDALEDKLLESLELEQPVLNHGHFVGRSESRASATDSGLGSEENSNRGDATDEEHEDHKCADCGSQICGDKRWEVKVFAANGLMKAGAWGAAWSEMEKVDVQVSVWLPEAIRQEIEARIDAVIAQEQQLQMEEVVGKEVPGDDERTKEIYGESTKQKRPEERTPSGSDIRFDPTSSQKAQQQVEQAVQTTVHPSADHASGKADLQAALLNYIWLLLQDRRNIAIVLLTVLLASYGLNARQAPAANAAVLQSPITDVRETKIEYLTSTVISTSTSIALQTSTVTETTTPSVAPILAGVGGSVVGGDTETSFVNDTTQLGHQTQLESSTRDEPLGNLATTQLTGTDERNDEQVPEGVSAQASLDMDIEEDTKAEDAVQLIAETSSVGTKDEL